MKLIKNINLVLNDKIIKNGSIAFDNKIKNIYKTNINKNNYDEVIDGEGGYLTPGLINIHIHGAGGYDTMEGSYQAFNEISKTVIKHGVTGFLPTTMTMEKEEIKNTLKNIRKAKKRGVEGAEILGVNVEGPFINSEYKGAQNEKNIIKPDFSLIENFTDIIKIITIAPEIDGAEEFIKKTVKKGIIVSVGHSGATKEDVNKAKHWGLSHATHLFNAMTGLHHRHPGIVGATLVSDLSCELIADFIHLRPSILKLVTKAKEIENIILITDSMEAAGLAEGEYDLGGQKVTVKDGAARLNDGTLAGSILTMDRAVKNMYNATDLELFEVINMATLYPAKLIHVDNQIGKLEEEYLANLTLFNKDLNIKKVYINGKEIFKN